jgi:hypothetical protein
MDNFEVMRLESQRPSFNTCRGSRSRVVNGFKGLMIGDQLKFSAVDVWVKPFACPN